MLFVKLLSVLIACCILDEMREVAFVTGYRPTWCIYSRWEC